LIAVFNNGVKDAHHPLHIVQQQQLDIERVQSTR